MLHEKTGDFTEYDEIEELHRELADVLFKMERQYWKQTGIERERAAKKYAKKYFAERKEAFAPSLS